MYDQDTDTTFLDYLAIPDYQDNEDEPTEDSQEDTEQEAYAADTASFLEDEEEDYEDFLDQLANGDIDGHAMGNNAVDLFKTTGSTDIRELISARESNRRNPYQTRAIRNGKEVSSATGKYQFLWNTHKDWIQRVTGVASREEFLNSPQAQEQAFDYWDNTQLTPVSEKYKQKLPQYSKDQLKMMLHFAGESNLQKAIKTNNFNQPLDKFGTSINSYINKQYGGESDDEIPDATATKKPVSPLQIRKNKTAYLADQYNRPVVRSTTYVDPKMKQEFDNLQNRREIVQNIQNKADNLAPASFVPFGQIIGIPASIVGAGTRIMQSGAAARQGDLSQSVLKLGEAALLGQSTKLKPVRNYLSRFINDTNLETGLLKTRIAGTLRNKPEEVINRLQFNKYGITDNQRKGYNLSSELAYNNVDPFGYKGLKNFGKKAVKDHKETIQDAKDRLNNGTPFNELPEWLDQPYARDNAFRYYLGKPVDKRVFNKYRGKTSKNEDVLEIANQEKYTDDLYLNKKEGDLVKFMNGESFVQLKDRVMGGYNLRKIGNKVQYNDRWDLDFPFSINKIPTTIRGKLYETLGEKNFNKLFYRQTENNSEVPRMIKLPIEKIIGKPFTSQGEIPIKKIQQDAYKNTYIGFKKYGGPTPKPKPIVVTDKNDPRYKSYKDSLDLFTSYQNTLQALKDQNYKNERNHKISTGSKLGKRYLTDFENKENKYSRKKTKDTYEVLDFANDMVNTSLPYQLFNPKIKPSGIEEFASATSYFPWNTPNHIKVSDSGKVRQLLSSLTGSVKDIRPVYSYDNVNPKQEVIYQKPIAKINKKGPIDSISTKLSNNPLKRNKISNQPVVNYQDETDEYTYPGTTSGMTEQLVIQDEFTTNPYTLYHTDIKPQGNKESSESYLNRLRTYRKNQFENPHMREFLPKQKYGGKSKYKLIC